MENNTKRIKYKILIPKAIKISNYVFGHKARNKENLKYLPPFFIIGSGRNGSTLLASILNNHTKIFIPPEQYFMPFIIMKWHICRYMPWEKFVQDTIKYISDPKQSSNWNIDYDSLSEKLLGLTPKYQNISNLIYIIYDTYSLSINKNYDLWGDKTPIGTHYMKYIYDEFNLSKYIFLIRDPRDVVLSYLNVKNHKANNPNYAIWKWNDSIKTYDWIKNKTPNNILLIKYENLVSQPDVEINKILNFLEIQYELIITEHQKQIGKMGVDQMEHHKNLRNPINQLSIGKWKQNLNNQILESVLSKTQNNMARFDYLHDY